jgi:hypothetical protein
MSEDLKVFNTSQGPVDASQGKPAVLIEPGKVMLESGDVLDLQQFSKDDVTIYRVDGTDNVVVVLPELESVDNNQLTIVDFFSDSVPAATQEQANANTGASVIFSDGYLYAKDLEPDLNVPLVIKYGGEEKTILVSNNAKLNFGSDTEINFSIYKVSNSIGICCSRS